MTLRFDSIMQKNIQNCWQQFVFPIGVKIINFYNPKDGEGNGTPLQHSCLENPMDGGAW